MQLERWKAVISWIPEGSRVVELAAGTGCFYLEMLNGHVGDYVAIDINQTFVENLRKHGIHALQADIRKDLIPSCDILIMLCALYHFKQTGDEMLKKLLRVARQRVIIVEPISQDLKSYSWRNRIRGALANIGEGPVYMRYTKEELQELCLRCADIEFSQSLPGNEHLFVLHGKNPRI
jgi:ubiquinone/menaquinone biosynthesis C-methylase UbiE